MTFLTAFILGLATVGYTWWAERYFWCGPYKDLDFCLLASYSSLIWVFHFPMHWCDRIVLSWSLFWKVQLHERPKSTYLFSFVIKTFFLFYLNPFELIILIVRSVCLVWLLVKLKLVAWTWGSFSPLLAALNDWLWRYAYVRSRRVGTMCNYLSRWYLLCMNHDTADDFDGVNKLRSRQGKYDKLARKRQRDQDLQAKRVPAQSVLGQYQAWPIYRLFYAESGRRVNGKLH